MKVYIGTLVAAVTAFALLVTPIVMAEDTVHENPVDNDIIVKTVVRDDGTVASQTCSKHILAFPAWFNGLSCNHKGEPYLASLNSFWIIGLNMVEMLIVLTTYFAVGYVVWGGFKYMKSQGEPGAINEAKMAIIQAIAGLCIALGSVAIVNFIQGGIK